METSNKIVRYNEIEATLSRLREQHGATVWVVDTKSRMASAKKARAEVRKGRLGIESIRKEIKADALAECKMIDAEARRITAEFKEIEDPIDFAIKEVERREKEEKAREEKREAARIEKANKDIADIRAMANFDYINGQPESDVPQSRIEQLDALDVSRDDEFAGVAIMAKEETLEELGRILIASLEHEEEQEKIAAERAELARLKAENAERERKEAEEKAAEEAKRRKAEEESQAKIRAAEREAQDRIDEKEREARAERKKADDEAREIREAEAEKIRAEREKVEAKEREERKQEAMLLDGREMLDEFRRRYADVEEFSDVVKVIDGYFAAQEKDVA